MEKYFYELKKLARDINETSSLIQNDDKKLLEEKQISRQELWENYYDFENRINCHIWTLTYLNKNVRKEFLKLYDDSKIIKAEGECYARYTGRNGFNFDRNFANSVLEIGTLYRVVGGSMGHSKTDLVLEGFEKLRFNSVMFEIEGELPFKYEDSYITAEQIKEWKEKYSPTPQ
jgi:hypothetical protein